MFAFSNLHLHRKLFFISDSMTFVVYKCLCYLLVCCLDWNTQFQCRMAAVRYHLALLLFHSTAIDLYLQCDCYSLTNISFYLIDATRWLDETRWEQRKIENPSKWILNAFKIAIHVKLCVLVLFDASENGLLCTEWERVSRRQKLMQTMFAIS